MNFQLALSFFIFTIFLFILFRFYVYRFSFQRINNYIQSKSRDLENKLSSGVESLSDVSISMFVDVKKYEYLRDQISFLVDRFELKKKDIESALGTLEKTESRFQGQNKKIQSFIQKNDKTLEFIAKSENNVDLLKKSIVDMGRCIEGFGNEKEKKLENLFNTRLKKINILLEDHEDTITKRVSAIEDELNDKKELILSMEEKLMRTSGERYRELMDNLEVEVGATIDEQQKKIDEQISAMEHLSKDRLHVFHAQFDTAVSKQGQLENKYQKLGKEIDIYKQDFREKMNQLADGIVDDFKIKVEEFQEKTINSLELRYHSFNDEAERWEQQMFQRENELSQEVNRRLNEVSRELEKFDQENTEFRREIFEKNNDQMQKLSIDFDRVSFGVAELEEKNNKKEFLLDDFSTFIDNSRQMIYQHTNNLKTFFDYQRQEGNRVFLDKVKLIEKEMGNVEKQIGETEHKVDKINKNFIRANNSVGAIRQKIKDSLAGLVEQQKKHVRGFLDDEMSKIIGDVSKKTNQKIEDFIVLQKRVFNTSVDFVSRQVKESQEIIKQVLIDKKFFDEQISKIKKEQLGVLDEGKKSLIEQISKIKKEQSGVIDEGRKSLNDQISKIKKEQSGVIDDGKKSLNEQISKIKNEQVFVIDDGKKSLNDQISKIKKEQSGVIDDGKKSLNEQISKIKNEQVFVIDEGRKSLNDQISKIKKEQFGVIDEGKKNLTEQIFKIKSWWNDEVLQKTKQEKEEFKKSMDLFLQQYKDDLKNSRDALVGNSKKDMEKAMSQALSIANKNVGDGKKEIFKEVKEAKVFIVATLKKVTDEKNQIQKSGEKIASLENILKNLEKEHAKNVKLGQKEVESIRDKIRKNINLKNLTKKVFDALKGEAEKEMTDIFANFQNSFTVDLETTRGELEKMSNQSSRQMVIVKKDLTDKFDQEKNDLLKIKDSFSNAIDHTLKDQKQLKNFLKTSKVDMEERVSTFKLRVQDVAENLNNAVGKRMLEVDKKVSGISKMIESFFKESKVIEKVSTLGESIKVQMIDYEKKLNSAEQQNKTMDGVLRRFDRLLEKKKDVFHLEKELKIQHETMMRLDAEGKQFISETERMEDQMKVLKNTKSELSSFLTKAGEYEKEIIELKEDLNEVNKKKEESAEAIETIKYWEERLGDLSTSSAKISKKLDIGEQQENRIKDRLEKLDEKTIKLQENYKDLGDFHAKYEQLDYLVEDMDARMKALEEMRKKMILERNAMMELREKLNDQIKIVLKYSFNGKNLQEGEEVKKIDKADLDITISRLHAIGWSKKDIAQHLGMDGYEVELILKELKKI